MVTRREGELQERGFLEVAVYVEVDHMVSYLRARPCLYCKALVLTTDMVEHLNEAHAERPPADEAPVPVHPPG